MKPITSILVAGLLFFALSLSGQTLVTNFAPATVTSPVNSTVTLEFKVTNFTNIASMQFPIKYNNTLLQFVSVNGFMLPELASGNFNNLPAQGIVRFTWFPEDQAAYPNGVTVADGTTIFTISFKVLGNGNSTVNIDGIAAPGIEIRRSTGALVTLSYQSGGTTITGGTVTPPASQVQILANTIYIPKDSVRCMPVTVNNFTNVISMQYAMHWNTTVLQYQSTKAYDLPYLTGADFNVPATPPGTLLLGWADDALQGVTRPNGHKIYEVCFKGIGAIGSNSLVTIDGTGLPPSSGTAEALNTASQNIWGASSGVTDTLFVTSAPLPNTSLTFSVDKDTVAVGGSTCVDVRVRNFNDVLSLQYGMTYDPTKLTLQTPTITFPSGNPLELSASVGGPDFVAPPTIAAGTIRLGWADDTAPFGVAVPNNGSIYAVCFNVQPSVPAGTTIPINIGSVPGLPAGFGTESAGEVPAILNGGHIYVSAAQPCTVTGAVTNVTCAAPNTGAINLTVSASCPNRTFAWAGPSGFNATTEDVSSLTAGSYTVTVTFTGGTTQTATFTVTAPTAISATSSVTPVTCFGGQDGAITLNPTGGTAPLTFAWTGPSSFTSTAQSPASLGAGSYTVVISDANGCSFTPPAITVAQPNAISIPTNQVTITNTCFGQTSGAITINPTGGTPGYTYAWTGPNGFAAATKDITGLAAGSYTVTVTDSKGCTFVSSPAYTVQSAASALDVTLVSSQNVSCSGNCNGQITINVTGGTPLYSYSWRNTATNALVSNAKNPTNLCPGTYNVTVTDAAGCTDVLASAVTITQMSSTLAVTNTQTNVTCPGASTGAINLTVTGANGATTFAWSPTLPAVEDPIGISAGTYTATVTDANGCTVATQPITITQPQPITIGTPQVNNVSCFGGGNGGIVITPAGGNGAPYNVNWINTPLSGQAISNLSGGFYTPVVSDALGCTAAFSPIQVTEPTQPITLDTNVVGQNGSQLGSIDLIVTGGTPSYLYVWSTTPNVFTEDLTNQPAGTYTVTVTDANGCTIVGTYAIPQSNPMAGTTITGTTNSCNNDGCITITVPAGVAGPFQATWAGSGGPQSFPNNVFSVCGLAANFYTITVTASNGSTATVSGVVNQSQPANFNSTFVNPFDDQHNGSITLVPAFPGAVYQWSVAGQTSNSLSGLDAGTYTVTVTNPASGCTAVGTFTLVRQYEVFVANATETDPTCASTSNGSVTLTVSGGDGPNYTYQWTGPNGFTATTKNITNRPAGTYNVTITDESGTQHPYSYILTAQSNLSITNVNETSIYPGGYQVSSQNNCNGAANVAFTGGVGATSILWSNSATTASTNTLCGGAYSVTVTDNLGCTAVWTDALTVPEAVSAMSETSTPVTCHGACNGAARVFASGGVGPYTVTWSTGQSEPVVGGNDYSEAVNLCGGTYTVTITDNNGATTVEDVIVDEPAAITVQFSDPIVPNTFNSCDGQLFANVSGAVGEVSIVWSGSLGHNGTGPRSEGLCANEVVQYVITDANNCAAVVTDTVPYPNDGCLRVRPVLTPVDQDGNNDYVHITCIETVRHRVEIFNRWGQLVFQTENYQNNDDVNPGSTTTWYGLNKNGQPFAEGVYYYILTYIDVDGNEKQLKGHINLLK